MEGLKEYVMGLGGGVGGGCLAVERSVESMVDPPVIHAASAALAERFARLDITKVVGIRHESHTGFAFCLALFLNVPLVYANEVPVPPSVRKLVETTFSFPPREGDDPDADVVVVGSFSEEPWVEEHVCTWNESLGMFTNTLYLPPGRHEFKFVVDGEWTCSPVYETTRGSGFLNNVVELLARDAKAVRHKGVRMMAEAPALELRGKDVSPQDRILVATNFLIDTIRLRELMTHIRELGGKVSGLGALVEKAFLETRGGFGRFPVEAALSIAAMGERPGDVIEFEPQATSSANISKRMELSSVVFEKLRASLHIDREIPFLELLPIRNRAASMPASSGRIGRSATMPNLLMGDRRSGEGESTSGGTENDAGTDHGAFDDDNDRDNLSFLDESGGGGIAAEVARASPPKSAGSASPSGSSGSGSHSPVVRHKSSGLVDSFAISPGDLLPPGSPGGGPVRRKPSHMFAEGDGITELGSAIMRGDSVNSAAEEAAWITPPPSRQASESKFLSAETLRGQTSLPFRSRATR